MGMHLRRSAAAPLPDELLEWANRRGIAVTRRSRQSGLPGGTAVTVYRGEGMFPLRRTNTVGRGRQLQGLRRLQTVSWPTHLKP